jgi:NAD(P)-dependent dehydrogenase (short-subunit alcohol dehydrogenase family)
MMSRFAGRRILVTGAGKGIGRDLVSQLSREGATLVALSRQESDLEMLSTETGCETITADLEDIETAANHVRRALPIDMLVNNAGILHLEPAIETTMAHFSSTLAVNTLAPLRLAQIVAADLIRRGQTGAIVNISSIAASVGFANHAAYCASKAALDALTRVLAVELGPHGIRTNSVNPVVTLTPMARVAWSDVNKAETMLGRIPLGRFAEPGDISRVVSFLLSDDSVMLNGVSIDVDGGFRAG